MRNEILTPFPPTIFFYQVLLHGSISCYCNLLRKHKIFSKDKFTKIFINHLKRIFRLCQCTSDAPQTTSPSMFNAFANAHASCNIVSLFCYFNFLACFACVVQILTRSPMILARYWLAFHNQFCVFPFVILQFCDDKIK